MVYLFSENGFSVLDSYCESSTLFAFDYDGTLAAIVADPAAAQTSPDVLSSVSRLADLAPTAVISGRGRRDLSERFAAKNIYLVGNHGIEGAIAQGAPEFEPIAAGWVDQLTQFFVACGQGDVLIEDKAFSLSVHYRNAKVPLAAKEVILRAIQNLVPAPRIILGDAVVNIVPQGAPHKGHALLDLMQATKAEKVIFVGDDQTDEDVFGLDEPNLLSIKVRSPGLAPIPTQARYYIASQSEVSRLLQYIITRLERR